MGTRKGLNSTMRERSSKEKERCSKIGFESTRCSEFEEEDNLNDLLLGKAPFSDSSSRSTLRRSTKKLKAGDDKLSSQIPSKTRNLFLVRFELETKSRVLWMGQTHLLLQACSLGLPKERAV